MRLLALLLTSWLLVACSAAEQPGAPAPTASGTPSPAAPAAVAVDVAAYLGLAQVIVDVTTAGVGLDNPDMTGTFNPDGSQADAQTGQIKVTYPDGAMGPTICFIDTATDRAVELLPAGSQAGLLEFLPATGQRCAGQPTPADVVGLQAPATVTDIGDLTIVPAPGDGAGADLTQAFTEVIN